MHACMHASAHPFLCSLNRGQCRLVCPGRRMADARNHALPPVGRMSNRSSFLCTTRLPQPWTAFLLAKKRHSRRCWRWLSQGTSSTLGRQLQCRTLLSAMRAPATFRRRTRSGELVLILPFSWPKASEGCWIARRASPNRSLMTLAIICCSQWDDDSVVVLDGGVCDGGAGAVADVCVDGGGCGCLV